MNGSEKRTTANKQTRGQGRTPDFPRLLGERLCLHFVNTVEAPATDHPADFLPGYADLVRWSWHADTLPREAVDPLLRAAAARPAEAAAVLSRARALRAACDGVFRAVAGARTPAARDLAAIHVEYVTALGHARLAPANGGFAWTWPAAPDTTGSADAIESADVLDGPLWPVARSAVELLTDADLRRVKECPGAGDCGWLFYDTSRSRTRQWCSMEGCGSRLKMRRHHARHGSRPRPPRG
ncbi:CGNR zinc finger domain-containing protein [Streptomyces sp. B6B3]|uniref:CGNR zinc finger domain-containing protein n=1 Tax=Streptomyces sp. B6B3 TaxID=3153570 RepID=UPI00325F14BE